MEKQNLSSLDSLISIVNVEKNKSKPETGTESQSLAETEIKNYKKYSDFKKALVYVKKYQKDVKKYQGIIICVALMGALLSACVASFYFKANLWEVVLSAIVSIVLCSLAGLGYLSIYRLSKKQAAPLINNYLPSEYKYLLDEKFFNIAVYYHYLYDNPKEINNRILNECATEWSWSNMDFKEMCERTLEKEGDIFITFLKEINPQFNLTY